MVCNAAGEWARRGEGDYDYVNNSKAVYNFWEKRVKEVAGQDNIYTLGMRGVHDGKMQGAKTVAEQKAVLERVLKDQRGMLAKYVDKDVEKVPQAFIPYKEVLDIYHAGLEVPEEVTLIWCDDNYGYIRHFPTEEERARKGGNGIYYHISYWGRPHDYLWLNTLSPAVAYQQMNEAYDRTFYRVTVDKGMRMSTRFITVIYPARSAEISASFNSGFSESSSSVTVTVNGRKYDLSYTL
jgi:hypothetical protein